MTKININGHKKVFNKRKFKFQEYKNCLEAAQKHDKSFRKKVDIHSHKEFIKNNELILKT